MVYLSIVLILILQICNNLKQIKMSIELDGIKADIAKASELAISIKADIVKLDSTIAGLGNAPSVEELQALKLQSADLVSSLQSVDDLTPDAPVVPVIPVVTTV